MAANPRPLAPPHPYEIEGRRLRAFVDARWGRANGGIRGLSAETGITPETLHSWFRGDNLPSLTSVRSLATALDSRPVEVVAAIDAVEAPAPVVAQEPAWVEGAVNRAVGSVRGALLDPDLSGEEAKRLARLFDRIYRAALEQGLLQPPRGAVARVDTDHDGGRQAGSS